MDLDRSLLKGFAQIVKKEAPTPKQYVRGTIAGDDSGKFVQIDGSSTLTPISEVVDVQPGDRVLVAIENHVATILGNFTYAPSARKEQEALDKANEAVNSVGSATAKAEQAITTSSQASALANEAKQESVAAKNAADNVSTLATEAKNQAAEAVTKAEEANTSASNAINAVNDANQDIKALQKEVEDAKANIKSELSAEFTQNIEELESEFAKTYATKNENVALEGRLDTKIQQTADTVSSQATKIETLESNTTEIQNKVDQAMTEASNAKTAADAAKEYADNAVADAEQARQEAEAADVAAQNAENAAQEAREVADAADALVQSAQADLDEAQQNYDNLIASGDATDEEIAAAEALVNEAREVVNQALADAAEAEAAANDAREAADKAYEDASSAQQAAIDAQKKANAANKAADTAQEAADKANADVAALTHRVTTAETNIKQNADNITLNAKKVDEIGKDLADNYYTRTETNAEIKIESDNIKSTVNENIIDNQQATIEQLTSALDQTASSLEASIREVKQTTDSNSESIVTLNANQMTMTSEFTQFTKTTTDNIAALAEGKMDIATVHEWARFDGARLELGASNSPFKAILTNTELGFWQGDNKIAWISNNELHVLTAVIVSSIGCGNFMFIDEGDLGFSLM